MSTSLPLLAVALLNSDIRVALAFTPESGLTPGVVASAVSEAAALWSPHGVSIELAEPEGWCEDTATLITIAAGRRGRAGGRTEALASVGFTNGAPAPSITVFVDELIHLIERARLAGTAEWQWPRVMRERIIGRALGRVLAHEIGHILLQSRDHAGIGLMRSAHAGDDLIAPARQRFLLVVPDKGKGRRNGPALRGSKEDGWNQ